MSIAAPCTKYISQGTYPQHVILRQGPACADAGANSPCFTSTDRIASCFYERITKAYEFFDTNYGLKGVDGTGRIASLCLLCPSELADSQEAVLVSAFIDNALSPELVGRAYMQSIIAKLHPLDLLGESGALAQSIADVFGLCFMHWYYDEAQMGADKALPISLTPSWSFLGQRDISAYQHAHVNQSLMLDQGCDQGVFDDSIRPSHAFFLAVRNSKTKAYGVISYIWYLSFLEINSKVSFREFARRTVMNAQLIPDNSITTIICQIWPCVGVYRTDACRRLLFEEALYKIQSGHSLSQNQHEK